MIRLIGAVLLSGGAATLGFSAVKRLEQRVNVLNQLVAGLSVIRRELEWRLTPLPELLSRASGDTTDRVSDFFRLCSVGAMHLNGRSFQTVWKQGLEGAGLRLDPEDMAVVERLGGVLGRFDGGRQGQVLDEAVDSLRELCGKAREQRDRLGAIYGALGLTAGAFLVILLI